MCSDLLVQVSEVSTGASPIFITLDLSVAPRDGAQADILPPYGDVGPSTAATGGVRDSWGKAELPTPRRCVNGGGKLFRAGG